MWAPWRMRPNLCFPARTCGVNVLRTEGQDGKRWILLDYGSVIVHVFTQEAHDFYDLEHLWADGEPVPESTWRLPEEPAAEAPAAQQ